MRWPSSLNAWLRAGAMLLLLGSGLVASDDGPDIHFWIVENTKLDDGRHRTSALFLFHRTTNPDGTLHSSHYLNYVDAPGFTAVLPLWYRVGEPGREHSMLVPLWFQGPGYGVAPLALSGGWTREDGGHSTWITPLFHLDRRADGSIEDMHLLTWAQGDGYRMLLPFFYQAGQPGRRHTGVIPVWFSGPDYWTAPLALSAGWTRADGGSTTWVTPLFHVGRDASGKLDGMHLLTWFRSGNTDVFFPLYWSSGPDGAKHRGVVPVWIGGPGYWGVPALLSGGWRNRSGGTTTWITPLFHRSTDQDGTTTSFHALNWFHARDLDVVLPLFFSGPEHTTFFPLWFSGPRWWAIPPLLSGGGRGVDGSSTTWITPFYHRSVGVDGRDASTHLLTWFSGRRGGDDPQSSSDYQVLFPFFYRSRQTDAGQTSVSTGVVPCWFDGPGYTIIPPALTAWWTNHQGGTTTVITPLYHRSTAADGSLGSLHAGLWYQDHETRVPDADGAANAVDRRVLFPFYWRWDTTTHGVTTRNTSILPLWFSGPDYLVIPPLLTSWKRNPDGGTTTWVTPFYHSERDRDGTLTSMHALTWVQSGDTRMLLPFYFSSGPSGARSQGVIPFWFMNPEGWTVPPALSWHRRFADGSSTTWITPLAHVSRDATGDISSLHVLNWFQGRDWQAFLPFAYRSGQPGRRHLGIIPAYFSGPDYWYAPLALSGGWKRSDGGTATWITPLAHIGRDAQGAISDLHVLAWFQGRDWQMLFPFAYRSGPPGAREQGIVPLIFTGPNYWAAPLALSAGWKRADGGHSTWITPLFHHSSDREGRFESMHALTWLSGRNYDAFLPFAWRYGEPGRRYTGILPVWLSGPTWAVVPPLLSGRWHREDGGRSTWITPLFHVGSDATGKVTDWHAVNWFHDGNTDVFAPLLWFSGPPEARSRIILPLFFQGPRHLVVAPLYYRVTGDDGTRSGLVPFWFSAPDWWISPVGLSAGWTSGERRTTVITPFYHRTTERGQTKHMHLLNYISTPEMQAVAPIYWSWRTDEGGRRTVLAPLWYQHTRTDGDFTATAMPLLFSYHSGNQLDTSLGYQLFPFILQRAPEGHEVNVLWRVFHLRSWKDSTEVMVWPLWWSEHRDGQPASWQVLGGLFGRDCDRADRTSLSYAAWGLIRFGGRLSYATP